MPKLRPRLFPTKILLILAALACGFQTTRAQEAAPAAAPAPTNVAATKAETSLAAPAGDRNPASAPAARAIRPRDDDAAFFTGALRDAQDSQRPVNSGGTLPSLTAAPGQSGGADFASTTPQQTQPSQSSAPTIFTPLTPEQKMRRAAKSAFLSPGGYARVAFSSIMTQWKEDSQPQKSTEDEVADGASRFAINFGRRATRSLLGGGVFPVLFRQDPRYERAEEGAGAGRRAAHAVSRVFVTRGDSGRHQPNVSNWAGSLSSSALSNLWERSTPGHDRIGTDATFKRFAKSFVWDSVNNVVREFWPDIKKIFKR